MSPRAYPINMLSRPDHHVLNDTLGGQPIAVTWCGLCQAPLVFARQVEGKTLTLFVSGELYGENMLMKDVEQAATGRRCWARPSTDRCRGGGGSPISSVWTDWKTWRTEHPETTALNIPQTVDYYRHDPVPATTPFEKRYFAAMQWGLA